MINFVMMIIDPPPELPPPLRFKVGDKIRNIHNFGGTVTSLDNIARTYDVLYRDGRTDLGLSETFLRSPGKLCYFTMINFHMLTLSC